MPVVFEGDGATVIDVQRPESPVLPSKDAPAVPDGAADRFDRVLGAPSRFLAGGSTTPPWLVAQTWEPKPRRPYELPAAVPMGASTIHLHEDPRWEAQALSRYVAKNAFVPLPSPEFPGVLLDLNGKDFEEELPDRAIIGDLSCTLPFVGIDKRPGMPLFRWLEKIAEALPKGDPEAVLVFLRDRFSEIPPPSAAGVLEEGQPSFDFTQTLEERPEAVAARQLAGVGLAPREPTPAGIAHPVVAFETFWESGPRACFHQALLAALILEHLEIPCRLRQGTNDHFPDPDVGHAWIDLPDGRVLDLAMGPLLAAPNATDPDHPTWFRIGELCFRYPLQTYPYLAWPT